MGSLPPPSPKRSRFAAVGDSDAEKSPRPVKKILRTPVQPNKGNTPKAIPVTPSPNLLTRASLNSLNRSRCAYNCSCHPLRSMLSPLTGAGRHQQKRQMTTNPLRSRHLERSDGRRSKEYNTCENNQTVANWNLTGRFANDATVGSVWVEG